ncbi:hypothetical protein ACWEPP_38860, partial [Streptomyces murinus]
TKLPVRHVLRTGAPLPHPILHVRQDGCLLPANGSASPCRNRTLTSPRVGTTASIPPGAGSG